MSLVVIRETGFGVEEMPCMMFINRVQGIEITGFFVIPPDGIIDEPVLEISIEAEFFLSPMQNAPIPSVFKPCPS